MHVERYVPQSLILSSCRAVICHAGFNTTMAACATAFRCAACPWGRPGAQRCRSAQLGVGISCAPVNLERPSASTIDPDGVDPAGIRIPVRRLLLEDGSVPGPRLRAEIEAMPGPDVAGGFLELLAARLRRSSLPAAIRAENA